MRARILSLLLLMAGLVATARADIVVVVHADSPISTLTSREVSDFYLGRLRNAGGTPVQVLDLAGDPPLRERFFKSLNGMDLPRVNAYWARLQFSGNTLAPHQMNSDERILEAVSRNRQAIGYIGARTLPPHIRVVLSLKD